VSDSVAWVTVAASDLDTYLTGIKVDALQTAALSAGQTDPFIDAHVDVIARIRNKIKSCSNYVVSATANTIPPELKSAACWLILEAMNARVGLSRGIQLTEDQKTLIKKFEDDLTAISKCDLVVSTPTDPEENNVQAGPPMVVISSSPRVCTRASMNGL
jgi:hypothetical protein